MDNSVIAKSGWIFKRKEDDFSWRKQWVELYRDGFFKFYESDHSPNAEDTIFMPNECSSIRTGSQVDISSSSSLPPKHSSLCLFSVGTSNKIWLFCASSLDDMRAWQLALEQARLLVVQPSYPSSIFTPHVAPLTQTLTMTPYMQTYHPSFAFLVPRTANLSCNQPPTTYPMALHLPFLGQSLSPEALEMSMISQGMQNCPLPPFVHQLDPFYMRSHIMPSTSSGISRPMTYGPTTPPFWW